MGTKILVLLGAAWPLLLIMLSRTVLDACESDEETLPQSDSPAGEPQSMAQHQSESVPVVPGEQADPTFSIIIVAHNEEMALPALLKDLHRLISLSAASVEILFVDERSSDDTALLLHNFCDKREEATLYAWPDTEGKCDALKKVIPLAKGRFVAMTDADCRLDPKWADSLLEEFEANLDDQAPVDLISAPVLLCDEEEEPSLCHPLFRLWQSLQWMALSGNASAFALLKRPISAFGANLAFRRETLESMGGYSALVQTKRAEDLELFMQMRQRGARFKWSLKKESLVHTRAESFQGGARQLARWLRSFLGLSILAQIFLLLAPLAALAPFALLALDPLSALALITAQVFAQWRLFHSWATLMHKRPPALGSTLLWQSLWTVMILRVFVALLTDERDWRLK
jgi:glycosyltransferase involved in cell wall biosynthesis